ncbi:hypothetical protein [Pseudomonas aeruginosa]|uniref:hypothetical protein n=1 Tax=Pseudomonas aeruginosa TaxID=287 RepID=UPI0015E7B776|nr:hypothetical protein [Pseudomonas aeruginosa]
MNPDTLELRDGGVYSREHVERWLAANTSLSSRARMRRAFLDGLQPIEVGGKTYLLQPIEDAHVRVHCGDTAELKALFKTLDEAADAAGFLPRWAFYAFGGGLLFLVITGLVLILFIPYISHIPRWVPMVLLLASFPVGAVSAFHYEKKQR